MKTLIVLAMHGSPPADFPRDDTRELFSLHQRIEGAPSEQRASLEARHAELEEKMRRWPRTSDNDAYWAGSMQLGEELARESGMDVLVAFNEFCRPSLAEALDEAAAGGAEKVLVVTPMATRGGEHSEKEIPHAVDAARARHPEVSYEYVWPMEPAEFARFLATQAKRFL